MNRKLIYVAVLLLLLLGTVSHAQVVDAKGDMFFNAQCYPKAVVEYKKAVAKRPDDAALLRRLAEAILQDESPRSAAIPYIDKYIELVSDDVEAYYLAAQAHFHGHEFSKAKKYLDNYRAVVTSPADTEKSEKLASWINNAQRMLKDSLKCTMVNLGDMINTSSSEINPFITDGDHTLYFSSDEKYNSMGMINYFNVKYSENTNLSWSRSKAVGGLVNTIYDEYITGLTKDGMYFSSNRDVEFALYDCRNLGNGRFSDGERLMAPIDMKGDETSATGSVTGDTIVFAGTCANGKLDLFYSIRWKGAWTEARPLPGEINLEESDENYPCLANNGKRLYFSSDREGSYGGMDLYYSDYDDKAGVWKKPVHLKYPINDTYDNLTISYTTNKRYAYVSAIRPGGFGGRDIYAVVFDNITPSSALIKCFVGVKAKPKPVPLSDIPYIEVLDVDGEKVADLKMKIETSTFVIALDPGTYTLRIEADGAKDYEEKIVIPEKVYDQAPIDKIIVLEPNKK